MEFATSYFGNRILRHVQADMIRLRAEGLGVVVHTFSENDLRYYRHTMTRIVAASQEAGLRVWLDPWGLGGVFGGEAFSDAALQEADWAQISSSGSRLPACCPSNPGFRNFVGEWIGACLETGTDGIFWDVPHFFHDETGGPLGCSCKHCQVLAEELGASESAGRREALLLSFVVWVCRRTSEGGGKNIVCLLPPDRCEAGRLNWQLVARAPGVENLGTIPFWVMRGEDPDACTRRFAQELVAITSQRMIRSHIWIQGFQIPAGREHEITTAMRAAGRAGIDVIAIWGFEACESMSALACERPDVAWKAFLEGIRMLSGDIDSAR
jgi:hypothetical protein